MIEKIFRYYSQKLFPKVRHIRGFTRFRLVLKELALRKVEKVSREDEMNLFDQDWDNLIIIDACRQDFFEEETEYSGSRVSRGSTTQEYIVKNFSEGDYSDIVYVAANPHFSDKVFEEKTGRKPDEVFDTVFKSFNSDWNHEHGTVLPDATVKDAKTAMKLFPDKKLVIHFMPPHYPFVRKQVSEGIQENMSEAYMEKGVWPLTERGVYDHEVVEEAYRDNMDYVTPFVEDLAEELSGKTMLTSDHGNFVGEAGVYGHPYGRMEKPVKVVPWLELD